MPIFIRQNVSHPPKIFLSETSCVELPKNLFICFKGTLASLLLDITKTPHSYLLLLNFKQRISPQLVKLQITENHLKPPKTIFKHPKPSTIIQNHSPKNICNHPKPIITTQNHPQLARIYLELAVTSLKQTSVYSEYPQSFTKYHSLLQKLNSFFQEIFASIDRVIILRGGISTRQ